MENQSEVSDKQRSYEISKQVRKELGDIPESIRDQFLVALENISWGLESGLTVAYLKAVGKGVAELKINGRPAYRLVYTTKFPSKLVVLAARSKTCEGQDKKLIEVAASRLKDYK